METRLGRPTSLRRPRSSLVWRSVLPARPCRGQYRAGFGLAWPVAGAPARRRPVNRTRARDAARVLALEVLNRPQAPARSTNVTLRLHLGTSRSSFRSWISAHGGQGGRGREIHISHSLPHAAARLRVQARQRRPRHSRHPSLSRPPLNHVHGPLYGLDAQSV